MSAQHTPGPWAASATGSHVYRPETQETLAAMDEWHGDAEREANARLIAAAPELLAELKALADHLDARDAAPYHGSTSIVTRARAAIAKAEGRS